MKYSRLFFVLLFLLFSTSLFSQILFRESTFDEFEYPDSFSDNDFVEYLEKREQVKFPKARTMRIKSFLTRDDPRTVVAHYTRLCGQRFYKVGDRLVYNFSEINRQSANRIEIYPVKIPRVASSFWPTRIDIFLISYPVTVDLPQNLDRSLEDLRKLAGNLTYEGKLEEEVALMEMEELGSDANVFVVSTQNSFESVYRFFRNRYGTIRIIPAIDGDVYVRDFDFDATRKLGLQRKNMTLIIRVDENPIIIDDQGNSQVYHDHVFIKYMFYYNQEEQ